ncbi:unnamed protein product [Sphagnum jensenii]|uniref:Acyl-[acyl-carrier-protein] hydrolase n=1 Tax=Sphagnum jensenii TaxID=128206 RepID=A0ABP1B0D5_9BRYO
MEVLKTMYANNFSTSSSAFLFSKFRSSISHYWRSPATRPLLLLKKLKRDTICCTSAMLLEPTDTATAYTLLEFGKLDDDLNCPRTSRAARSRSTGTKGSNFTEVQTESDSLFSGMVNEALTTSHTKQQRSKNFEGTESRRREMIPLHKLRQGGFVENCLMYRQVIVIRSYEVGPDMTISIDTIFRLFQEMALCHVQLLGIAGDGFGATQGMNRNGLIWVVNRMHVEVERYPAWPEVVEIDSWVGSSGKNGMRRDWVMSSYRTGEVLARATSKWCMMDATTRRLARIPEEVQAEIVPCFIQDRFAFPQPKICPKIQRIDNDSAQYLSSHLKSCRGDLDVNQHVSNLKYISWVFESVPSQQFNSHDLKSMTLEYRRECNSSDVVESLTSYGKIGQIIQHVNVENRDGNHMNDIHVNGSVNHHIITNRCPECSRDIQRPFLGIEEPCKLTHLLHTQSGHCEILRGQTTWQPRKALKL